MEEPQNSPEEKKGIGRPGPEDQKGETAAVATDQPDPPTCRLMCSRLCSFIPIFTTVLILTIACTTIMNGWILPVNLIRHYRVEMYIFIIEVLLLLWSNFAAILRGPGFVPRGWTPKLPDDLRKAGKLPLQIDSLPLQDCLQFCKPCGGYKPPRGHHCSTCGRCTLWMDHHCPWINTCVGHANLKAFTLFVLYVPIACCHSLIIDSEVLIFVVLAIRKSRRPIWTSVVKALGDLQILMTVLCWLASLIIMLLVGGLAWEMFWTVSSNLTMIEENVVDDARLRRGATCAPPFVFPFDLGSRRNLLTIFGRRFYAWLLPTYTGGDAIWPKVRPGSSIFDLSTESLAQKAVQQAGSVLVPVSSAFSRVRSGCCMLTCKLCYRFGCGTACAYPGDHRPCLTVKPGDRVYVSRFGDSWNFGRLVDPHRRLDSHDSASQTGGLTIAINGLGDGEEGWLPRQCLEEENAVPCLLLHQELLQGYWQNSNGMVVDVSETIVHTAGSRMPFVLRAGETGATELLGAELLECNESIARWSTGEVWRRQLPDKESNGEAESQHASSPRKGHVMGVAQRLASAEQKKKE